MSSNIMRPIRRSEMIQYLCDLTNVSLRSSAKEIESLNFSFHFFLDDTNLLEDPECHIGYFLADKEEASVAQAVAKQLDLVIERYGGMLDNEEYLAKPEWEAVIKAAQNALECFSKTG